ncbi:MAG: hydroxyacid dehydrogenase [Candidatus Thorarchaeota archaeon]
MKVLIADNIDQEAVDILKKEFEVTSKEVSPNELLDIIHTFDAIIVRSRTKVTSDVINKGIKLKAIARAGIGVDNIDVEVASSKKIPILFAPQGSTISVAELTIGVILSLIRKINVANESMKNGLWEKKSFKGTELYGKSLGLIGSGRIGTEVAKRCLAFGMKIQSYDPYISEEIAKKNNISLVESLDQLLSTSDIVSIHALLTEETKNMIDYDKLKLMKPSSYLINISRGGIINENDLIRALKESLISGAALDVYQDEPLPKTSPLREKSLPLILTPHIGASTSEAQNRAGLIVVDDIIKVLKGNKPTFCVNPQVLH